MALDPMLSQLTKTITESELQYIAALDYGQDSEKHLAALRSVVFHQDGDLQEGLLWHPYEVIELGAHSLAPGHEREFFFCTILVLQAVIGGYDTSTNLAEKLNDRSSDYDRLPAELREHVLRAYQLAGV